MCPRFRSDERIAMVCINNKSPVPHAAKIKRVPHRGLTYMIHSRRAASEKCLRRLETNGHAAAHRSTQSRSDLHARIRIIGGWLCVEQITRIENRFGAQGQTERR